MSIQNHTDSVKQPARIAIGGIWHETNTFAATLTRFEDFESYQFVSGDEMIERYRGTNTEIGGMIQKSDELECLLIPTVFAAAVPSGTIEHHSFLRLVDDLIERFQNAMPLDGVALAMHGAAVAEGIDDADAFVLEKVRATVKSEVPIVVTFDYHANLSQQMVQFTSAMIGYDTYPHSDMAERGSEAFCVLAKLVSERSTLHCAFRKLPLLTPPLKQQTDEFPMARVMNTLSCLKSKPDIACASIAMGFPYSDVAHLGASLVVYSDNPDAAEAAADALTEILWELRRSFSDDVVSVTQCIEIALKSRLFPVVLVEPADNIGGGSAGDATGVLEELLRLKVDRSVIVINDPEAVKLAVMTGIGNEFTTRIGGKTDALHGTPVEATLRVESISDGKYVHKGSYMTGYITSMGQTAVTESHGVRIVLTSRRSMPFDAEQLRSLNIEPENQKIIVVKSAIAWKAAFGKIAREVLIADSPGVCTSDLSRLDYRKRPKPLYPLEQTFSHYGSEYSK